MLKLYNLIMKINKKTSFSAVVELPYDYEEVTINVELDKDEEHLTYDEVEDAIYDKIQEEYNEPDVDADIEDLTDEDYPHIIDIVINADDGESYPVISESMDDTELKKDQSFNKYLVLPDATYTLTPEAQLWMNLKKNDIIDEDAEFDYEKYHKMVEENK